MKKLDNPAVGRPSGLPATIGRYRIVDHIGKGAMGIVYSAVDDLMDRQVAVKVMMTDLEGEPETRARFYREAQVAARWMHPNIITIFDVGEAEGRAFIVMELLRGSPLPEYLKLPDIGLDRKLDLMVQLCEALSVAHASGVFHRDIKPSNLFVQHDGLLKVLDFGIARLASSNVTTAGFLMGTPDYMSPEQARGKTVDGRSDIFSAGGVFYFILTGRKPFDAADLPAVLFKVEREDPRPLGENEAPVPLARVVAKMLAKEPERRYQRCQDVLTDLMRFKRSHAVHTRRLGPDRAAPGDLRDDATVAAPETADTGETVDTSVRPQSTEETVTSMPGIRAAHLEGEPANGDRNNVQSDRGQVLTEWLMIAGVFVAFAVFVMSIFPAALTQFVRSLAMSVRTVAP
jgi:serine/threonine protein kinase